MVQEIRTEGTSHLKIATGEARFIHFGESAVTVGTNDLCGCTNAIIVSHHGVYFGHFVEDPSFNNEANFRSQVITPLKTSLTQHATALTGARGFVMAPQKPHAKNAALLYPTETTTMQNTIRQHVHGVSQVDMVKYLPLPAESNTLTKNSRGAALVQYDPEHNGGHIIRVFIEKAKVLEWKW